MAMIPRPIPQTNIFLYNNLTMAHHGADTRNSRLPSRRRQVITIVAAFLVGATTASLIFVAAQSSNPATTSQSSHPIRLGQQGLVNPLLEYTTALNQFSEMQNVSAALRDAVSKQTSNGNATNVGVFLEDLTTARWAGANQDAKFSPASMLKVPVMITYLRLADQNPAILNHTVLYDGSFDDNAAEDIKPLKSIQAGKTYAVNDLLKYMIGDSDNNADALLFTAGATSADFSKTYTDIGVPEPTSTNDFIGPRLFSRFFRVLYNATYLSPTMSERAMELLSLSDFPQGIAEGVPDGVTVAQKFGEHDFGDGAKELHDCGIVYHATRPYVLCIMTKGTDFTKLATAIETISHLAWQKVDSNYQ